MNLMVTGAGTLIGNEICVHFLKKKYNVICTYNENFPTNLQKFKNSKLIKLDLKKKIPRKFETEILIHCASATPERYKGKKFHKINVIGFKNLLSSLDRNYLRKIILLSSFSVYEKNKQKVITENTIPKNKSAYAKSKSLQEITLKKTFKDKAISLIVLRLSSILSKKSDVNFYCKSLKKIKSNSKITIIGKDKKVNSIFFINDLVLLVNMFTKIRLRKKFSIFNVASKKPIALFEIIKKMHIKLKKKIKIKIINRDDKSYVISNKKLQKLKFTIPSTSGTLNKFLKSR